MGRPQRQRDADDGAAPWRLIVLAAEQQYGDLIAVGQHDQPALDDLLLGSTTRQVIAYGRIDVPPAPAYATIAAMRSIDQQAAIAPTP